MPGIMISCLYWAFSENWSCVLLLVLLLLALLPFLPDVSYQASHRYSLSILSYLSGDTLLDNISKHRILIRAFANSLLLALVLETMLSYKPFLLYLLLAFRPLQQDNSLVKYRLEVVNQ
ncbi:hypothetical protein Tco_1456828 [Tanacetum coccineum]